MQSGSPANINTRKRQRKHNNSNLSEEDMSCLSMNSSGPITRGNSLPDLSTRHFNKDELQELRDEINALEVQLDSAHTEIESLIMENNKLIKAISELEKKTGLLKSICGNASERKSLSNHKSKSQKKLKPRRLQLTTDATSTPKNHLNVTKYSPDSEKPQDEPNQNVCHSQESIKSNKKDRKSVNQNKKIFIFGGQQCSGLASALLNSRLDTNFEKYEIVSFIKPNAKCTEILQSNVIDNIREDDKIVICVGEHDTNPTQLTIELSYFIKRFCKSAIFVISVSRSDYLNEIVLNNTIKLICNNSTNCKYVNTMMYGNRAMYLSKLCDKINMEIDSIYYKEKYLTFKTKKTR